MRILGVEVLSVFLGSRIAVIWVEDFNMNRHSGWFWCWLWCFASVLALVFAQLYWGKILHKVM